MAWNVHVAALGSGAATRSKAASTSSDSTEQRFSGAPTDQGQSDSPQRPEGAQRKLSLFVFFVVNIELLFHWTIRRLAERICLDCGLRRSRAPLCSLGEDRVRDTARLRGRPADPKMGGVEPDGVGG